MPVDLSKLPQSLLPIKKFSWWFWGILLLVLIVTGSTITFIISFFYSLSDLLLILGTIVIPACLWIFSLLYGIYYRGYREEYIKQWNIHHDKRKQQLVVYARRGLYILYHSLITEYGEEGNGNGVASNHYSIITKRHANGDNSISHSALSLPNNIKWLYWL
ncbi:hypothetical protein [Orbus mooreae]|uniref:hypothetical protein n=1 Tax=Orbus mooreae TaxID=3074107 RepID=UPI00370DAB75